MSNSNDGSNEDEVDWLDCISAIRTRRGTIFFCDRDLLPLRHDLQPVGEFGETETSLCGVVMYSITAYNPMNQQIEIIENVQRNTFLLDELNTKLPGCEIMENYSFFPSRPKHFENGFTVVVPLDYPVSDHDGIVCALAVKYRQAAYFRCVVDNDGKVDQKLILLVDNKPKEVNEQLMVIERVNYRPPLTHHMKRSDFQDQKITLDILSHWRVCVAVEELLAIMLSFKKSDVINLSKNHNTILPINATECPKLRDLDLVCRQLILSLKHRHTIPNCIRHLKEVFDAQPPLIRRVFYAVSNYILGLVFTDHTKNLPVITDTGI